MKKILLSVLLTLTLAPIMANAFDWGLGFTDENPYRRRPMPTKYYYYNAFDNAATPPENFTGFSGNTSSSFSVVASEGIITKGTTASQIFAYDYGYAWPNRYLEFLVTDFTSRVNIYPLYVDEENYINVFISAGGGNVNCSYEIADAWISSGTAIGIGWTNGDTVGLNVLHNTDSAQYEISVYRNDFMYRTFGIPYNAAIDTGTFAIGCETEDLTIDTLLVRKVITPFPTLTNTPTPTFTITTTTTPTKTITATSTASPTATETPSYVSPMLNSPTAYAATWRDENCGTYGIMSIRGTVNGAKAVYDVEQGTTNFQYSSGPDLWMDAEGNTAEVWFLVDMYNQTNTAWAEFIKNETAAQQPVIKFNQKNGYPSFYGDVSNDMLREYTNNIGLYIDDDTATIIINYKPLGTPETQAATYDLPGLLHEGGGYFGMHRGIRVSGDDKIFAYMWGPSDEYAGYAISVGTWYSATLNHQNSELRLFINGSEVDDEVVSATHGGMTNNWFSISNYGAHNLEGEINCYIIYDTEKSDAEIESISNYCEEH